MEDRDNQIQDENKHKADLLLHFINENYKYCKNEFKKIFHKKGEYNEDMFSDVMLRTYNTIERRGFNFMLGMSMSGKSFMNYMCLTWRTTLAENGVKKQRLTRAEQEFIDDIYTNSNNNIINDEELKQIKEYILLEDIFSYVEANYKTEEAGIFKFYFLGDFSYRKIESMTIDYSYGTVYKIINKIKADVMVKFLLHNNNDNNGKEE